MDGLLNSPIFWLVAGILLLVIFIYNNLNSARHRIENSLAKIDTYLQERMDDITMLLDNANNVAGIEAGMQEQIAKLRSGVSNYNHASINDKITLDNGLRNFLAVSENYPEFRSIDEFKKLSNEMIKDNEELTASRNQCNNNITSYNTKITAFPTSLIANIFGFTKCELLTLTDKERAEAKDVSRFTTGATEAARLRNQNMYK